MKRVCGLLLAVIFLAGCGSDEPTAAEKRMQLKFDQLDYEMGNVEISAPPYQENLQRLTTKYIALIHQYVPPSPDKMQAVISAGNASIAQAGTGRIALKFAGYAKPNDALTLNFDTAIRALQQISVNTWLDKPENTVTLNVTMTALPDGTSYPATTALGLPKSDIEVRVTRSNYQKIAK